MNAAEFERLKLRFGDEIATWPAPHRQEARHFLARGRPEASGEEEIERLVLEASAAPTDEAALARAVIARVGRSGRRSWLASLEPAAWSMPATAASVALLLMASALGGYVAAGSGADMADEVLLGFAVGIPPSEIADAVGAAGNEGGQL